MLRNIHQGIQLYCGQYIQHQATQTKIILDIFDTNYGVGNLGQAQVTNSFDDCNKLQISFDSGYNLLLTIERSIISLKDRVCFLFAFLFLFFKLFIFLLIYIYQLSGISNSISSLSFFKRNSSYQY